MQRKNAGTTIFFRSINQTTLFLHSPDCSRTLLCNNMALLPTSAYLAPQTYRPLSNFPNFLTINFAFLAIFFIFAMLDRAGYKNGLSVEYSQMPPSIHPARQRTLGKTKDGQMVEMEYSGRQIRACRFESGAVRKQNNGQWQQIKSTNRRSSPAL